MVPWGPGCGWKCPVAGCNMGLKDAGSSGQHQHHVRMQHRAAAHPEANKELFCLPSGVNPTKASVACSNRGAAARVLGLGIARRGGHDPVWLSYPIPPPVGERKKAWKEGLLHRIFCKDCCNLVRVADDLAARDCVPGCVNPTVRKMLRRMKARLEEPNVAEYIVKATRETIRVLEAAFAEAAEEDDEHDIQAVAWPGEAWTVKFLCGRCGWLADEATGNKRSCSRLGRRRPTQAVEQLREVAKEEDGPPATSWTPSASSTRRATRRRSSRPWRGDLGWARRGHEGLEDLEGGNFERPHFDGQNWGGRCFGDGGGGQCLGHAGDEVGLGCGTLLFLGFSGGGLDFAPRTSGARRTRLDGSRRGHHRGRPGPASGDAGGYMAHDGRLMALKVGRAGLRPLLVLNIYLPAGDKVPGNHIAQEAIQWARNTGEEFVLLGDWNRTEDSYPLAGLLARGAVWTMDGGQLQREGTYRRSGQLSTHIDFGLASPRLLVEGRVAWQTTTWLPTGFVPARRRTHGGGSRSADWWRRSRPTGWADFATGFDEAVEALDLDRAWQLLSQAAENAMAEEQARPARPRALPGRPVIQERRQTRARELQTLLERRLRRVARRASEAARNGDAKLRAKLDRDLDELEGPSLTCRGPTALTTWRATSTTGRRMRRSVPVQRAFGGGSTTSRTMSGPWPGGSRLRSPTRCAR